MSAPQRDQHGQGPGQNLRLLQNLNIREDGRLSRVAGKWWAPYLLPLVLVAVVVLAAVLLK